MKTGHRWSEARQEALRFLYGQEMIRGIQEESVKERFERFVDFRETPLKYRQRTKALVEGVLDNTDRLDAMITQQTQNWKLNRIATIDKIILRIACFELLYDIAPKRVILDEAIELAKVYSDGGSGAFINGVLDAMVDQVQDQQAAAGHHI